MDELTDLVLKCKAGAGIEELNKLLEAVYPHLLLVLRAYCGNDPNVPDFAQETMTRIVRNIRKSRAKDFQQFCSWSATIARHIVADHYRKPDVKRLSVLDPDEIQRLREAGTENEGSSFGLSADADRVLAVIAGLGRPCRQ